MKRPHPRSRTYSKDTLVFMAISIGLMVTVHFLFLDTFDHVAPKNVAQEVVTVEAPLKAKAYVPQKKIMLEAHDYPLFAEYNPGEKEVRVIKAPPKPAFSYSLKNTGADKARIAIVIDDVGMNRKLSHALVEMSDVPLTLAFLPYAPKLKALTEPAQEAGHELIIHMPMEPMDGKIDTGPIALKSDMDSGELKGMLEQAFDSFEGYVGLNNHMGSRLTQDKKSMDVLMDVLDQRGLFYLDSKTISSSLAANAAREQGIRFAERDVFLDHEDSLAFVRGALKKAEKIALEKGSAIAIGHPKANTIAGLKEWIPTLEARGFEVVPVSDLLLHPHAGDVQLAHAEIKPKPSRKPFIKKTPELQVNLQDIEPAAGDIGVEALLSAPTGGLYLLSE